MENSVVVHNDDGWNQRVNMLAWKFQYEQPIDKSDPNFNPHELIAAKILLKTAVNLNDDAMADTPRVKSNNF